MIRAEEDGDVTFFRMARTLRGRPLYWTGAYLVDGWLLDCGPPATARELLQALEGRAVGGRQRNRVQKRVLGRHEAAAHRR